MKSHVRKEGPFNIFQARIYLISDELMVKRTFASENEARAFIFSHFNHEHNGPLLNRGIIRVIDPMLKTWICPFGVDNNKAIPFNIEIPYDSCKVTVYSIGDTVMTSLTQEGDVSIETIKAQMMVLNAFYAIKSFHTTDLPTGIFVIESRILNENFNLKLRGKNLEKQYEKIMQEDVLQRYAHLMEEDEEETKRIKKTHPDCFPIEPGN